MSRKRSYEKNAGSGALLTAVGGVALVGVVGYVVYRAAKRSSEPRLSSTLPPPGGRPPAPATTSLVALAPPQ